MDDKSFQIFFQMILGLKKNIQRLIDTSSLKSKKLLFLSIELCAIDTYARK
jgi:hypothetical protein